MAFVAENIGYKVELLAFPNVSYASIFPSNATANWADGSSPSLTSRATRSLRA